jgi:hypothetical protein
MNHTIGLDHRPPRHKGLLVAGGLLTLGALAAGVIALAFWAVDWELSVGFSSTEPCSGSDDSLTRAAADGDLSEVRDRLAHHTDPDAVDDDGQTALGCAVSGGHAEVVTALLDHGADPNQATRSSTGICPDLAPGAFLDSGSCNAPIAKAAATGRTDVVARLVDHGADPTNGLYAASMKDDVAVGQLLLDRGAKPNGAGRTSPLLYNVMFGNGRFVTLLLDHGADPNFGGPADAGAVRNAALFLGGPASGTGAVRGLACAEQGTAPNLPPLVVAAALDDGPSTTALLAHGADPNATVSFTPEVSALGAATATHATAVAAQLVQAGAHPVAPPAPAASVPAGHC